MISTISSRFMAARQAMRSTLLIGALVVSVASHLTLPAFGQSLTLAASPSATVDQNSGAGITATVNGSANSCSVPPAYPYPPLTPCSWTWTVSGGAQLSSASSTPTSSNVFFYSQYTPGQFTITASRYGVPAASIVVTVSPLVIQISGQPQIPQGETARFTATMSGMQQNGYGNMAVNWFLSGGGTEVPDSTCSYCNTQSTTVTAGYTAGTYTLTAQSVLEPWVSASMPVTVLPPPVASISPTTATMAAGQYVLFTGSAINTSDPNINLYTDDPDGYVNSATASSGYFSHFAGKPGGQFHVIATSERGGTPATATVTVVSVILSPGTVTVLPGTSRQFFAELTGSQQTKQWSTTVPGAAISSSGLLKVASGTAAGSYSVTVQTVGNPVATSTAAVTVANSIPVTAVAVSPSRSVLDSGGQEPFTAVVEGQNGEPNPNQAVTWSVSGPASAAIAANGLFTAPTTPGVYTVRATSQADATKTGTATVTVGEDLMVLPSSASLSPGASKTFQAVVTGVASPTVTWSVEEGAAGGTISAGGLYTAPATTGVYHVVAVSSAAGVSVQGIATVVVSSSPQITVAVSPVETVLVRGTTQQFTATVVGTTDMGVVWSASAGSIDQTGLFNAPTTLGTVTIKATSHADSRARAQATVIVEDGGQGQAFNYDANGNLLFDGTRSFEWDAENRLTAVTIGTHRSEFGYDGFGRRVVITEKDNGIVTTSRHYVWVGNQIAEETDATQAPTGSPGSGGYFDAIDCNQIAGWAWDATQPNTPITVDLYDGSTKIATALAAAYRGDLKASGMGNGNHGFFYPTPASLKTGTAHTVSVMVGGTSTLLGTRNVTCAAPAFGGYFDAADCTWIAGWAWDANQPNSPINVDIYDGATLIATVLAKTFRQDLMNAGVGNGNHSFFYPVPPGLKTGSSHTLTIKIGGTATALGTKTLSCPAPSFGGYFDYADCNQLAGWAWDANQPNAPINVDLYDGTTLLATVPANSFRQDLKNAGIGNGNHGFTYTSPSLYSGSQHSFTVRIAGSSVILAGSPKSVTCPIEPILTQFFPGGMRSGSSSYYFSFDHLGSVREVTDSSGNVVSRYDYDPYGRLTVNQGTPPRFGFGGYFYHSASGLSLTKYRAYDPDLGRWESRDPIGLAGGLNLYSYVDDDPTDGVDPLGLKKKPCPNPPFRPVPKPKNPPPGPVPPLCPGGQCSDPATPDKDPLRPPDLLPFPRPDLHGPKCSLCLRTPEPGDGGSCPHGLDCSTGICECVGPMEPERDDNHIPGGHGGPALPPLQRDPLQEKRLEELYREMERDLEGGG